ncbi:hypothetical protein [Actinophytocola xanthii]|uniref:hypothetical protein n=1 Tax=Actinophytocola xanthii TaxID=1912961 RepID=UPI001E627A21|nr:hypothetical protein [Actinophytocola xanthii]
MSEPSNAPPEAPHAPGTPRLEDLNVDEDGHDVERKKPDDDQDVREEAGEVEPPD